MILHIASAFLAVLSLSLASCEDIRTRSVHNYIWWIFSAGLLMLLFRDGRRTWLQVPLCIPPVLIQELVMSRAYGRADSHAFSCCAAYMILTGFGIEGHILHISLSLAMLTAVQLLRRNVGKDLKLIKPVPFIPYISLSFVLAFAML